MLTIDKIGAEINRDIRLLAPIVQDRLKEALLLCADKYLDVAVFEGWRSPARQNTLFAQGRSAPGKIVTQARAWGSYHQFGLAFDLAFIHQGQWRWDGDWDEVRQVFKGCGFESLAPIENAHFQLTAGLAIHSVMDILARYGLPAVWAYIGENTK